MSGSRSLATALLVLMLVAMFLEPAIAEFDYLLRPVLRRVELTNTATLTLSEKKFEDFGGVYKFTVTGKGNPLYAKGLLLTPNETGVLDLRLEILRAPSGYKVAVERIWMNPDWCDVHLELSAEGLDQPIRGRALELRVEEYVTQERPLILKLMVKPYAFKRMLPYGWIESCSIPIAIYGNVSFGANVKKDTWYLGFNVYVLNPEEELAVETKTPALTFVLREGVVSKGIYIEGAALKVELDVSNNLDSDVVLKNVEVSITLGSSEVDRSETELDYILKPGQSKSIKLEKEGSGITFLEAWNGVMMIDLYYLSERGSGIKRFLYAFDLRDGERLSPQTATTTESQSYTTRGQSYTAAQTITPRSTSIMRPEPSGGWHPSWKT